MVRPLSCSAGTDNCTAAKKVRTKALVSAATIARHRRNVPWRPANFEKLMNALGTN